ncbi:MAG: DUF3482 domain-containing protein [Planctomycetes bacterium]|nr:DUF3482 domain-containing protein [Planctomycetota bacterium]
MSEPIPEFVVVGNVNQGKSSVVATLIENGAVPIASYPGTTGETARYVFRQGGEDLFTIIDTPGFQDARAALSFMQQRARSPADRPAAVRAFVEAHAGNSGEQPFADEVRLLQPILDGAGILYVVDASSRFQPSHEAEMEILRWTGQPAMALLNRTRERDHSDEWRPILEQFFNLVREFDAHAARFADRLELLRGFREIRDAWRSTMERAITAMESEWQVRRRKAAQVIGELLADALGHVEKRGVSSDAPPPGLAEELEKAYLDRQRAFEHTARGEIERLYQHRDLERGEHALMLHDADLFSEVSWRLFGLDRTQLMRYGAGWGAAIGGGIDLAVGGASFLTGLIGGAAVGGLGGYFAGKRIASVLDSRSSIGRVLFAGTTGRFLFQGPATSQRYAWMLADRALTHYRAVRDRSHARQDQLALDADSGPVPTSEPRVAANLPAALRDTLDRDLRQVLKEALRGSVTQETRARLVRNLEQVLEAV